MVFKHVQSILRFFALEKYTLLTLSGILQYSEDFLGTCTYQRHISVYRCMWRTNLSVKLYIRRARDTSNDNNRHLSTAVTLRLKTLSISVTCQININYSIPLKTWHVQSTKYQRLPPRWNVGGMLEAWTGRLQRTFTSWGAGPAAGRDSRRNVDCWRLATQQSVTWTTDCSAQHTHARAPPLSASVEQSPRSIDGLVSGQQLGLQ